MNMLCTLMKRDSGRVSIDGHILGEEDGKIEGTIGIVFQGDVLDPLLTVRENLMIRGSLCGLDRDECAERTDGAMTAMGIGDIADRTGCCQGGAEAQGRHSQSPSEQA